MKKMRLPLLIVLGVGIIGIILGSFFDFQISSAIANAKSGLGLTISAIGPTIGFMAVALMGGGFIAFGLKKDYHIVLRILFFVLAACCFAVSIIYPSGEYFGVNGFYGAAPKWVGYFIVVLPEAAAVVGGYFLFRNCENEKMWIIFCVIIGILLLALLVVIPTIKDHMHRPRFRFLVKDHLDMFHKWYEPFKEYDEFIAANPTEPHDNFKSYPSGHSAEASILLVAATFFPMAENYVLAAVKRNHKGCKAIVLHSFSAPSNYVKSFGKYDCYFSVSPRMLSKQESVSKGILELVPKDRLLLETDSPDSGPNFVSMDDFILRIAGLLGMDAQELADITSENAERVFR